ncbi:MAG: LbetaH domain-containing protein [Thermomicrobiales bacterium]
MRTSLNAAEFATYLCAQVNHSFPDGRDVRPEQIRKAVNTGLERVEYCFSYSALPHYYTDSESTLNHLHSDQYATFLWFVANSLWQIEGRTPVADKLYGLNKALHGLDCMYDTHLPDIFTLRHCVGTVLGKARYANFFVALQGCTVGEHNGKYPAMGIGVALAAHASIIGNCTIGKRVSIGSNTAVFERDIHDDTTVYRDSNGAIVHRASAISYAQRLFSIDLHAPFPAIVEGTKW